MSKFNQKNCVELGRCHSAHGLRGRAGVELFNPEDSILLTLPTVWLVPFVQKQIALERAMQIKVNAVDVTPKKAIVEFEKIKNRTELEQFIPFSIWIEREQLPATDSNEFYLHDLVGLEVYSNKDDQFVGKIANTYQIATNTVLVIENRNTGAILEIPFIENFVVSVDLTNHKMVIESPEFIDVEGSDE